MKLDQRLVDAATVLLNARFKNEGGIAAAMYTEDGDILTGIVFDPEWGGGGLCAETGPMLEANKLGKKVTATVCVGRLDGESEVMILTPCGICQERLFNWGYDVEIAVPQVDDSTAWQTKRLDEVQPHHWVKAYLNG